MQRLRERSGLTETTQPVVAKKMGSVNWGIAALKIVRKGCVLQLPRFRPPLYRCGQFQTDSKLAPRQAFTINDLRL